MMIMRTMSYTEKEADTIRYLLKERRKASRDEQKAIRATIRNLGFRISDYWTGFTEVDFDNEVRAGRIVIRGSGKTDVVKMSSGNAEGIEVDFNDIDSLKNYGFTGFKTMSELMFYDAPIAREKGVYLILRNEKSDPSFVQTGSGGHFKGKDPNVSIACLQQEWVAGAIVVYIGKAGGDNSSATLQSRLRQYLRFGQGGNVGHWGGRLIWQLKDASDLIVCWKALPIEDPRAVEAGLIQQFVSRFSKRPFANLMD